MIMITTMIREAFVCITKNGESWDSFIALLHYKKRFYACSANKRLVHPVQLSASQYRTLALPAITLHLTGQEEKRKKEEGKVTKHQNQNQKQG